MTVRQRSLGQLRVSALGLGCMGMTEAYGRRNDPESVASIHRALDLGINFLDTADVYGPFTNEELVGSAIQERRDEIVLATKFGLVRRPGEGYSGIDGRPEYVKKCCDASLARLRTDRIDLYYQHRVDRSVPIEETMGALLELRQAGKVLHIGLSEASIETIRRAAQVVPITAVQNELSLWTREARDTLLPELRALGIGLVGYSPLGRGFLAGAIAERESLLEGDYRLSTPRFDEKNLRSNRAILARLDKIAVDLGITLAQLTLAWALEQGDDVVPIPGTKSRAHLEANVAALEVELPAEALVALERAVPLEQVAGDRYPAARMGELNG